MVESLIHEPFQSRTVKQTRVTAQDNFALDDKIDSYSLDD